MSLIQEESQDRDQHIPSNLNVKAVQKSLDECNEHGTGRCSEANSGTTLAVASLCFAETVRLEEGLPFVSLFQKISFDSLAELISFGDHYGNHMEQFS